MQISNVLLGGGVRTRSSWRRLQLNEREKISLISQSQIKKYVIYSDKEVGIKKRFRNKLNYMHFDQDNDSDEGTVQLGLSKCMNILTNQIQGQMKLRRRKSSVKLSHTSTSKRSFSTTYKSNF